MPRSRYRLGKRAVHQAETRQRIIEATAKLHEEVGPAATTISAVAERAGVQRLTVYRHFPDEAALFVACSEHSAAQYPPPNPSAWDGVEHPEERTEAALRAIYTYYEEREQGLTKVLRDAERLPALHAALAPMRRYFEQVAEGLRDGWEAEGEGERLFHAAMAHALEFWTWRSLSVQRLTAAEAASLMRQFISTAVGSGSTK